MAQDKAQESGAEIATTDARLDTTDLRSIVTFEDAISLLKREHGEAALLDAAHEIGDGFTMLDDKAALINVPFVMLQWTFAPGDFGAEFMVARVVTDKGDKYVVTDGGTGVCRQVRELTDRLGRTSGLLVERGLRKSEYDNEFGHGITYYLNV